MFAQAIADFDARVAEIDNYFQMLQSYENGELKIVSGIGRQIVAIGTDLTEWSKMLKGGAFLVLYNLVESTIRRGFQSLFDTITSDGISGSGITELIRKQWIMQKNRRVQAFDGSPKIYMQIADEIVTEIINNTAVKMRSDRLPISGNLCDTVVRAVCDSHGVSHWSPAAANGGAALTNVKLKRNALAHGNESFVDVGSTVSAGDLVAAKNEVVLFMKSILQNLQAFATGRAYALVP